MADKASRILLHFDIAAVHQSCVVIDLYGTSFRSSSLLSLIHRSAKQRAAGLPPRGVTNTDQLPVFAVIGSCRPLS